MVFRYCEERNQFYLAGKEKCITVFSISKVSQHVKVWTIGVNRVIADFEVFPYFDTIAIADEHNELRLLH